jgi:hypothetical protein
LTAETALAIWLYGSRARGDADEFSDTDLIAVSDSATVEPQMLVPAISNPSVSQYTWDEVTRMASYGSLFLRHLELEGQPVYESDAANGRLETILRKMGPYELAGRDVAAFRTVLRDVRESLDSGEASLVFELSTLATVFRHASVLGCYLASRPCFARTQPVVRLVALWNLPSRWADDFQSLYAYRMHLESRMQRVDRPRPDVAYRWCERSFALVDELSRRTDVRT